MIEKINVDQYFPKKEVYEEQRLKYIADYQEYINGYSTGLFGWKDGYYEKKPQVGEAKWNGFYPKGYESWRSIECRMDYSDFKAIADKMNEIIDYLQKS